MTTNTIQHPFEPSLRIPLADFRIWLAMNAILLNRLSSQWMSKCTSSMTLCAA
jgi:hypothetical protein